MKVQHGVDHLQYVRCCVWAEPTKANRKKEFVVERDHGDETPRAARRIARSIWVIMTKI